MPYLDTDGVESALASLAASYFHAKAIELPNPSSEAFKSHALQISVPSLTRKKTVLLTGGLHANEWGSCDIAINLAADLLYAYENQTPLRYGALTISQQEVRDLLAKLDFLIFPLVNPDGRRYSQGGETGWSKNRNPNYGPTAALSGVDLNRNFDFLFAYRTAFTPNSGVSASDQPAETHYQGPFAFSEPETKNVRWLLDTFAIDLLIDLHSEGEEVLYPWGDDESQSTDSSMTFLNSNFDHSRGKPGGYGEFMDDSDAGAMQALAAAFAGSAAAVRGTAYTPKRQYELYPTCGTVHDHAYSRQFLRHGGGQKTLSLVVEWGAEKRPPWSEMEDVIRDVTAGLIGSCLAF
jgi:murein tripeptide amidase MpaA